MNQEYHETNFIELFSPDLIDEFDYYLGTQTAPGFTGSDSGSNSGPDSGSYFVYESVSLSGSLDINYNNDVIDLDEIKLANLIEMGKESPSFHDQNINDHQVNNLNFNDGMPNDGNGVVNDAFGIKLEVEENDDDKLVDVKEKRKRNRLAVWKSNQRKKDTLKLLEHEIEKIGKINQELEVKLKKLKNDVKQLNKELFEYNKRCEIGEKELNDEMNSQDSKDHFNSQDAKFNLTWQDSSDHFNSQSPNHDSQDSKDKVICMINFDNQNVFYGENF